MKRSITAAALVFMASAAFATDGPKAITTDLFEDERVRAYEVDFAPGAEARTIRCPFRIVRALVDGTLERTAPCEAPVIEHWRADEVRAVAADLAGTRNIGNAPFRLYIVALKPPGATGPCSAPGASVRLRTFAGAATAVPGRSGVEARITGMD